MDGCSGWTLQKDPWPSGLVGLKYSLVLLARLWTLVRGGSPLGACFVKLLKRCSLSQCWLASSSPEVGCPLLSLCPLVPRSPLASWLLFLALQTHVHLFLCLPPGSLAVCSLVLQGFQNLFLWQLFLWWLVGISGAALCSIKNNWFSFLLTP